MNKLKHAAVALVIVVSLVLGGSTLDASARPLAATSPGLGAADSFAVLAGSAINDTTASSTITGDVGLSPADWGASALTCAEVTGTIYSVDASGPLPCRVTDPTLLTTAKNDLGTAYDNLAAGDNVLCTTDYGVGPQDLTLVSPLSPGVYCVGAGGFLLTGNLDLSGSGVWIFRSAATIITSSASSVTGIDSCNVWWRAETSATLGTGSTFIGNLLALASIVDDGGSQVTGRLLARNQAVTLNNTTVNNVLCVASVGGGEGEGSQVRGLPDTGGAPIRNTEFAWGLVIVGGITAAALMLVRRSSARKSASKK